MDVKLCHKRRSCETALCSLWTVYRYSVVTLYSVLQIRCDIVLVQCVWYNFPTVLAVTEPNSHGRTYSVLRRVMNWHLICRRHSGFTFGNRG